MDQYPKDPDLLILGAKFEQARGDTNRAAEYYRASLDAMPPPDPGAELATELSRPVPAVYTGLPGGGKGASQDLSTLLAPGPDSSSGTPAQTLPPAATSSRPYLPSYSTGNAPVQVNQDPSLMYGVPPQTPVVPSYMSTPPAATKAPLPNTPKTRLKDYVPQASVDEPLPFDATALPEIVVAENSDPNAPIVTPAVYERQQVALANQQALGPGPLTRHSRQCSKARGKPACRRRTRRRIPPSTRRRARSTGLTCRTSRRRGCRCSSAVRRRCISCPRRRSPTCCPRPGMSPNARTRPTTSSHPDIAAANAAAIRRRQSNPPATGESKPPAEEITITPF